jgi:hypothetical protein
MQVKLTSLTIVIGGTTLVIPEITVSAETVDLTIVHAKGRYGNSTLDEHRVTHVNAKASEVLVEDLTPGNEEKGVVFTPLGNESEGDEAGLWATIYGGRVREASSGTFTSGELWFGHGDHKVSVAYDPNAVTVGETGY